MIQFICINSEVKEFPYPSKGQFFPPGSAGSAVYTERTSAARDNFAWQAAGNSRRLPARKGY
jgi:hypothetical protein